MDAHLLVPYTRRPARGIAALSACCGRVMMIQSISNCAGVPPAYTKHWPPRLVALQACRQSRCRMKTIQSVWNCVKVPPPYAKHWLPRLVALQAYRQPGGLGAAACVSAHLMGAGRRMVRLRNRSTHKGGAIFDFRRRIGHLPVRSFCLLAAVHVTDVVSGVLDYRWAGKCIRNACRTLHGILLSHTSAHKALSTFVGSQCAATQTKACDACALRCLPYSAPLGMLQYAVCRVSAPQSSCCTASPKARHASWPSSIQHRSSHSHPRNSLCMPGMLAWTGSRSNCSGT